MQILRLNKANLTEIIAQALEILKAGGVMMHPTDTCFGLAVDVFNEAALDKLYALKKMDKAKPVSLMFESVDRALEYADFDEDSLEIAREFLPGPLTCIVKKGALLPEFLNKGFDSVGVRCPKHDFTLELLKVFGAPLSTTSANISGMPQVESVEDYLAQLDGAALMPDLIVFEEDYVPTQASTIVDFTKKPAEIVREGELAAEISQRMH